MTKNLLGRQEEIRRLDSCMREEGAQLIILYGRRRIGKTYLVNEYFHGRFDFKITGSYKEKKDIQLFNFAEELSVHIGETVPTPENWPVAFQLLRRYLSTLPEQEKCVLFFDEFPWLDTANSGFLRAFSHFWNDYGCATLCASSAVRQHPGWSGTSLKTGAACLSDRPAVFACVRSACPKRRNICGHGEWSGRGTILPKFT